MIWIAKVLFLFFYFIFFLLSSHYLLLAVLPFPRLWVERVEGQEFPGMKANPLHTGQNEGNLKEWGKMRHGRFHSDHETNHTK